MKRTARNLFLLLTAVNAVVFVFRDRFQYQPYATRQELYASCGDECLNVWRQFVRDYPEGELAQARHITDSLAQRSLPSYSRAVQTGRFLYERFKTRMQRGSDALSSLSPMKQYEALSASDTMQLWCGNMAQIFAWFCWSQDIPCRIVEIMKPGDRHVLNECYFRETGQWVMVDLTHNILHANTPSQGILNLTAFRDAVRERRALQVRRSEGAEAPVQPLDLKEPMIGSYYTPSYPLYYYHRVDNQKAYATANKVRSYFLPLSWYDILDEKKHSNLAFYLKQVFLFLWAASGIGWLLILGRRGI